MAPRQHASAEGVVVEEAEDEGEADFAATTSMEAMEVAAMAMTTRTTDAVANGSTASVIFVTRVDTCRAIATNSLMDGLLLKAKKAEEKGEGEEEAVEAVAVAKRAEVKGMGKAMFKGADGKMVGLNNVLWVPNLATNLISMRRLQKASMDTNSKGAKTYTARIGERVLWDLHENRDVYNEMWQIPVVPMPTERQVAASVSTKGEAVGSGYAANDGAKAIESNKCKPGGTRKQCELEESGAIAKEQHKVEENPKRAAEEHYGESIIVDVYTHMIWVYVLSKKSGVAETVKTDWLPIVERQQDRLVKSIRTDRGGEFLSKDFSTWLKKNGIRHSLTMPYSPAMNGIAERANRTTTETARGLLIEARLPDYFWPDAVRSACVAKNRVLTHVGAEKWVPYVDWIGRKPKVDMLRVLGCMCMALVPKHLWHNKLGAKAISAVHLGMAQKTKGWLLWDPFTKKFFVSRDCKFIENLMYRDWKAENEVKIGVRFGEVKSSGLEHVELPLELSSGSTTTRQSSLVNGGEEAKDAEEEEEEVQQVSERAPTLPSRTTSAPRIRCVKGPEEESVGEEERRRFHSLVGSLMYAAVNTRTDVAFATGQLARVVQYHNEVQVAAGMRVAKYLGQTPTVGLQYSAAAQRRQKCANGVEPGRLFFTAFLDSSYASEPEDMTSVGGFICCAGGGPTAWESKKQVDQALSSVESEYMALFRAVREIVWQRRLLAELGEEQQVHTPLYCDSQGAIALAKNLVLHGLTKHMRVKWHWTRSMVAAGEVELHYVKSTGQPADMMTKTLVEQQHWKLCKLAGMALN
ncbi:unnamed protein product [Closterium sp. NIES-53]